MSSSSVARAAAVLVFSLTVAAAAVWRPVRSSRVDKYPLLMPNVRPKQMDLYLCTPVRIDPNKSFFVGMALRSRIGFEPNATGRTSHHMLIYGCSEPGSDEPVWNCGEMQVAASDHRRNTRLHSDPCRSGTNILYAWARDAPTLSLPDGVGFKIGGDSQIDYLVLQVHYHRTFEDDETDNSGVYLHYTGKRLRKQAGVYLLATDGVILPHSVEYMETSCAHVEPGKVIHPFAYRAHTHELGKVVAGYRVRASDNGTQKWDLLGKRDPLTPQMFYPIENDITVEYGDIMAARCTMESERNTVTRIGPTAADEMCNFYVMYWLDDATEPLERQVCAREGPPRYYWKNDPHLNNIPDRDASAL